jgi:asparagine synthase (glutamine-hydrolysing)
MPEMFTLLNNSTKFPVEYVKQQFETGIGCPKFEFTLENVMIKAIYGGRTIDNVSPIVIFNDISLICDGTIYNSKQLFESLNIEPDTDYDYEIIVHLYLRYGIETTLQLLDGIFSFVLTDHRLSDANGDMDSVMFIVRDPFGVKPLYLLRPNSKNIMQQYNKTDGDIYAVSTHIEMLKGFEEELNKKEHPDNECNISKGKAKKPFYIIESVLPGTYSKFELKFKVLSSWKFMNRHIPYYSFETVNYYNNSDSITSQNINEAILKRIGSQQSINIMLTGGYEGFLNAAITSNLADDSTKIHTYSLSDSVDFNDIKLVIDHIGIDHTEISINDADIIQEKENINIYYNSANMDEVEFCKWWLMAKNISKKAPKSLVLLEVGIDELHQKKDTMTPLDFRFKMQQHFKTISENRLSIISKIFWFHGLETEFPWLDRNLVQYLVANTRVLNTIFKSKGIYGNILLPEELF